jgi:hypothetical protein
MHARQSCNLLLLVTLAAGAMTPAVGHDVAPEVAVPKGGGASSIAPIPDLSGIWGRDWFTFESPSSASGPIVGKLRRPDGTLIFNAVGDETNPILRPQAAEVVRKHGEMELSGAVFPSPHNQCWPEPTPYTLSIQLGMLMIHTPIH